MGRRVLFCGSMLARWRNWLILIGVGIVAGIAAYYLRPPAPRPEPKRDERDRVVSQKVALDLRREGDHLRISWDGRNPAIRQADHATLQILDGDHQTELGLTAADLATGSATYWPETNRYSFRLELPGEESLATAPASPGERPSPFQPRSRPSRRIQPRAAALTAEVTPEPPRKRSVLSRAFSRVPLLRRIRRKHR